MAPACPRCALPGPVRSAREHAAARHMPPPGGATAAPAQAAALPAPHCHPRARGAPCALSASVRPFSCLPFTSFPAASSFFFRPLLYLVVSFSTSRRLALQVGRSSLLTNSFSAWWWRSWLLLAAPPPFLPHPGLLLLLPGLRAGVMHKPPG